MKILEINKFFYLKRGAERHFFDVIDLLESNGHEVAIFSMNHSNNINSKWQKYFLSTVGYTSEYSKIEKIRGLFRMFYSFEAKKQINKLLDDFSPDVVHIHNIYHQLSPIILFEIKKRNIPIVMTVHDFKIVNPNHSLYLNGRFYDRCINGRFYQCFFDKCVKNSYLMSFIAMAEMYWHEKLGTYSKNIDKYIVPSEFVKNILIDRGISKEKITLLPHFISEPQNTSIQNTDNEKNIPYALCIGAISKNKGTQVLIDLFKDINQGELYIAGRAEDNIELENIRNVKYLGFLNKHLLSKYIKEAAFVISGSNLPETFGLVALESLSNGKPFFGFRSGAYSEIIENNKNGYLANSSEELKVAVNDFFLGEYKFCSEKISQDAHIKYSKMGYLSKLEMIFRGIQIS